MKTHTSSYKENVKLFGRELDSIISYTLNDESVELRNENLNSIEPHYEGGILKSVMRQLDIDSNVDIPINTEINYQFGVKVGDEYEYINFGNYIVYSSEKQEDTQSYKIICYDKMLYSMKDYEDLNITYPITIRNYINAICSHLGLIFKNANTTFTNYNQQINSELYLDSEGNSLGYTFRDVLDELAQVTASTICINETDGQLEVRYINDTEDTIDEEYLKDINVNFGEVYGPVNTIVFSRSAGTDKIYLSNPENLQDDEKIAIEIADNQILNGNDRDNYLSGILNRLDGLTYYLNDFSSTGITYYNLCDRYTITIGEQSYSCIMFNDDIIVNQGLEETIFTNRPEEAETDYTKADKTDRRINQTYLIVDKQNQTIEALVDNVDEQNEQIATIRLQYDEILSRISDIADITVSGESSSAEVELENVNTSQPVNIKIHPIVENISYLYPHNLLYPSSSLYLKNRKLRFTNTDTSEVFDWELPTNLWYYDSDNYDSLELSYGDGTNSTITVTRKCTIDSSGVVSVLNTPTTETYSYPQSLILTDGDYTISLLGYSSAYLYVQLMAKNIYTTQFYTKAETNSLIDQTAQGIELSVNQTLSNYSTTAEMNSAISLSADEINSVVSTKVGEDEIISKINQSAEQVQIDADKISLEGKTIELTSDNISIDSTNFSVSEDGEITASSGEIGGFNLGTTQFYSNVSGIYDYSAYDAITTQAYLIPFIESSSYIENIYDYDNSGTIDTYDLLRIARVAAGEIESTKSVSGKIEINSQNPKNCLSVYSSSGNITASMGVFGINAENITGRNLILGKPDVSSSDSKIIASGDSGSIRCVSLVQTSLEKDKKDFEKLESGLDIVKNTDIYKYHFNHQSEDEKKHIGFVIGEKYNYSKEITSGGNNGVDIYSMVSVCFKAIQEQQDQIEKLQEEIKKLKKESEK